MWNALKLNYSKNTCDVVSVEFIRQKRFCRESFWIIEVLVHFENKKQDSITLRALIALGLFLLVFPTRISRGNHKIMQIGNTNNPEIAIMIIIINLKFIT